ncbi:MAG: tRNA (adenine(22)-N(1))-methyltransferase TrmK, partial [Lachnospiraceae bacterium]|nr:tRNA (adenine(22)-N(1))-methyltransferase TrmK [Lachnospiraceae bacterium]
ASDVRPGPLLAAEKNIRKAGLEGKIRTVLADGIPLNIGEILLDLSGSEAAGSNTDPCAGVHGKFDSGKEAEDGQESGKIPVSPEQLPAAACVITGMGGMLITRILGKAGHCLEFFDILILSPQSEPDKVRNCLADLHFRISQERMVKEDGKYYTMLLCERGTGEALSKKEALYGPRLLEKRDPVLYEYLLKQRAALSEIRNELRIHGKDGSTRYTEVNELLEVTDEALRDY